MFKAIADAFLKNAFFNILLREGVKITSPESGKKLRMRALMLNFFLLHENLKVPIEGLEIGIY